MDAIAERQMSFVGTLKVEHLGRGEMRRITVRGVEHLEHHIARTELLVIDESTTLHEFTREVRWNQAYYRLAGGI